MKFVLTLFCFLFCFSLKAQQSKTEEVSEENLTSDITSTITYEQVKSSVVKHYPQILEALENVDVARNKAKSRLGAFDMKLAGKIDTREQGYYDGRSDSVKIIKPLGVLNSQVYGGYRISDGTFPTYEGKSNTLDDGEVMLGLNFSLGAYREIDELRAQLRNSKLDVKIAKLKKQKLYFKVQKESFKAYWTWVTYSHIYRVYDQLLKTVLERDKALKKRIARGDLAKIYATENRTYILKRKNQLLDARKNFIIATLNLSLFLRDKGGEMVLAALEQAPEMLDDEQAVARSQMGADELRALDVNPELRIIESKLQQVRNDKLLAKQSLNTKIDINLEVSEDRGDGLETLQGQEQRIGVSWEIPIERNLGRGKVRSLAAKRRSLQYKRQLITQQLHNSLISLVTSMEINGDKIKNTSEEVELAKKLEKAEITKFNRGASDYFVVNLREQNTAQAKVKNLKSHLEFNKSKAAYYELTMQEL